MLDANVYISAAIHPRGIPGRVIDKFLRESVFEIVMSAAIVDEVVAALDYPKVRKYIRADIGATAWFQSLAVLADFVSGEYELTGVSADPDDDKYIAAAVEGRAAVLVSGDPDLLRIDEHAGVSIMTPRRFLELLTSRHRPA